MESVEAYLPTAIALIYSLVVLRKGLSSYSDAREPFGVLTLEYFLMVPMSMV